jgi:hypothetical protein
VDVQGQVSGRLRFDALRQMSSGAQQPARYLREA